MEILQHPKNSNNITQTVKDQAALAVEHMIQHCIPSPNTTTIHQATQVNQRSFDITWQEVQKALEAALRITGFWYILLGMHNGKIKG